jgi:hypothetical protein
VLVAGGVTRRDGGTDDSSSGESVNWLISTR